MQFRVRRQTLIGDIRWADPYGDNWGWLSGTNIEYDITYDIAYDIEYDIAYDIAYDSV